MALCGDFLLAGCNVIHQNKICSVYRSFFWDMAKFHSSHQKHGHKTAFLTRESYQDALISTHFAVILICYMRDNFPDTLCRLDLTVSDPCECVFPLTGQWVGNTHNYLFGEMLDNINNMMRLQIMQANLNGPKFARGQKKQENNWHKQYTRDISRADPTNYPEAGEEITEWKEGKVEARQKAKEMGMTPNCFVSDQIENETSNDQEWFLEPSNPRHSDVDFQISRNMFDALNHCVTVYLGSLFPKSQIVTY